MPQLAPITLNNGASPPVPMVFNPKGIKDGVVAALSTAVGQFDLRNGLSIAVIPPSNKGEYSTVKVLLRLPKGIAGTDPMIRDHVNSVEIVFRSSVRSTDDEMKDLITLAQNALANTLIRSAIEKTEPFY